MGEIDFTIAVAVYNVENYLKECLDSIIGQLDDSMQFILVDDGSTDGCGKICDLYSQKDNRIEVIHQKNGGLSAARNTAIEHAHGKWIVFVDGDDRLTEDAMDAMKKYSEDAAQLIIFDYVELERNKRWSCCRPHGNFVIDTSEMLEQFRASTMYLQPPLADKFTGGQCITSWGKMWRLSYIKEYGYRFNTAVRRGEDNAFSYSASRNMSRVLICDDCVYAYRQNSVGIMRRFEPKTPEHFRSLLSEIQKDMLDFGETDNIILCKGFNELCMDGFAHSLLQVLAHESCRWGRAERIAYLKTLAQENWMQEAKKCIPITVRSRLLLHLMKRNAYAGIDLICRVYRLLTLIKKPLKKQIPIAYHGMR